MSEPRLSRFRVVVARTLIQVLGLRADIESLLEKVGQAEDLTRTPAYFAARSRDRKARPFVVAVYSGASLSGLVYGLERRVLGIPVGIVECGDSCGDGALIAASEALEEVLDAAMLAIHAEGLIFAARLSWHGGPAGALERLIEGSRKMNTMAAGTEGRTWLELEQTYESFLQRLGSQTRRNLRYFRRRAEQEGWSFVNDIGSEQASAAITAIFPHQATGHKSRARLRRYQQRLEAVPGAFFSGLRTKDGEWISLIGGWLKGQQAFILMQLNNGLYTKFSVSATLRSYLIENAISAGLRGLHFIDGCGGTLKKYCVARQTHHLMIRKGSVPARVVTGIVLRLPPPTTIGDLMVRRLHTRAICAQKLDLTHT